MKIDLSVPEAEKKPLIDLSGNNLPNPLPQEEINRRGVIYDVALGDASPGFKQTSDLVASGLEHNLKDQVVANEVDKKRQAAGSLIQTVAGMPEVEVEYAKALADIQPGDPESTVYQEYSRNILNGIKSLSDNEEVHKASVETGPAEGGFEEAASNTMAIREGLKSLLADTQARYKDVGYGSTAFSLGKQLLPFYNWYEIGKVTEDRNHLLPYSNLEEDVSRLYTMNPAEALAKAKNMVDEAYASDPMIGMELANQLVNLSHSEALVGNAFEIANLPGWGLAAKGAKALVKGIKAGEIVEETIKAAHGIETTIKGSKETVDKTKNIINEGLAVSKNIDKSVSETMSKPHVTPQEVLSSGGHTEEAAKLDTIIRRADTKNPQPTRIEKGLTDLTNELPSFYDPNYIVRNTEGFYKTWGPKFLVEMNSLVEKATEFLSRPVQVAAIPPNLEKTLLDQAVQDAYSTYNRLGDVVHEVKPYFSEGNLANISGVETTLLNKDGKFFKTQDQANMVGEWVYGLPRDSFKTVLAGDGYAIKVFKDIVPNDKEFLDTHIATTNQTQNRWSTPFSILRGDTKSVLPEHIINQRSTALHSYSLAEQMAGDLFADVRGQASDDLNKVMAHNRDTLTDPKDPKSRGMFYRDIPEFEEGFYHTVGRFPTEKETKTYFKFVFANQLDYVMRNLNAVQEKWAKGVKTYTVKSTEGVHKFEGVRVSELPAPFEGSDILFVKSNTSIPEVLDFTGKNRTRLNKLVTDEGYKILQTYDGKVGDKIVNFVVTKGEVESPLSFKQVNYNPGGHSVYEGPHKIVQPEIIKGKYKEFYKGDKIAFFSGLQKNGREVVKRLEEARKLLRDGKEAELVDYLNRNLPLTIGEFKSKFKEGGFDVTRPFTLVRSGEKSINTPEIKNLFPNAVDYKENPYVLNKLDDETFRQERGAVIQEISPQGQGWGIQPAQQVNPIEVQNREMSRLIRNKFYEPLSITTAQSFIEEFGRKGMLTLKGKTLSLDEMRRNPIWYFHNADVASTSKVDQAKIALIRNAHRNLLGKPGVIQTQWMGYLNRVNESSIEKFGRPVPPKLMAFFTNPAKYMKAFAFFDKMGFFNPTQVFVQGQSMAAIFSLAPTHAISGTLAAVAQHSLVYTEAENILDHAATNYAKLGGMSAEEFKDSFRWMKNMGMDVVRNEHAFNAAISDPELFVSKYGKKWLDKSTMFFTGTERFLRMAAWNTAYRELVRKNPKLAGKIDREAANLIKVRAEAMTGNMSRDSSAYWQHGVAAPFTQFYSYYFRMVDLFTGTQLTGVERLRLGLTFATLYGSNYAASFIYAAQEQDPKAVLNQFDLTNLFGEDIRTYAFEHGIDINDGALGAIANGIPATLIHMVTGKQVNFGDRYGVGGAGDMFKNLKMDLAEHDSTVLGILQAASGASGDIFNSIISSAVPAVGALLQSGSIPLDVAQEYIMRSLRNVSTVNQGANLVSALTTGNYYSKNGSKLASGIDPLEGLFNAITGLSPQSIADTFTIKGVVDHINKNKRSTSRDLKPLMEKFLSYHNNGDFEKANDLSNYIDQQLRDGGFTNADIGKEKIKLMRDTTIGESVLKAFVNGTNDPELAQKRKQMIEEGLQ